MRDFVIGAAVVLAAMFLVALVALASGIIGGAIEAPSYRPPNPYPDGVWVEGHWEQPPAAPEIYRGPASIIPIDGLEMQPDGSLRNHDGSVIIRQVRPAESGDWLKKYKRERQEHRHEMLRREQENRPAIPAPYTPAPLIESRC